VNFERGQRKPPRIHAQRLKKQQQQLAQAMSPGIAPESLNPPASYLMSLRCFFEVVVLTD